MHGNVGKAVELSLQNFGAGISYIDLLLLHCTEPLQRDFDTRAVGIQTRR